MKQLFKIVSMFWIMAPIFFIVLRLSNVVNVHQQNVTILIVLCGISYIAIFLNSDVK